MKNVYQAGGDWKTKDGREYTVKSVTANEFYTYLDSGWFSCVDDCFALEAEFEEIPEQGSDYESDLREQIKALGGKAGGRSSIKTLEKQLKELQDGHDN